MKYAKSVHELIGNTPLVELTAFDLPKGVRLFAKLEYFNPGGSVKDRLGAYLVERVSGRQAEARRDDHRTDGRQHRNRACACCDPLRRACCFCCARKIQRGETNADAGARG